MTFINKLKWWRDCVVYPPPFQILCGIPRTFSHAKQVKFDGRRFDEHECNGAAHKKARHAGTAAAVMQVTLNLSVCLCSSHVQA